MMMDDRVGPLLETFTSGLNLHDRQIALLRRVCVACEGGFRYRELDNVVTLLDLVYSRVADGVAQFEKPLCDLIVVCGRPIVREKANEELLSAGLSGFEALLGSLGKMLHMPFPAAQVQAALALQEIAQGKDTLRSNDPGTVRVLGAGDVKQDLRPAPRELNNALLLKAGVVEGAVSALKEHISTMPPLVPLAKDGMITTVPFRPPSGSGAERPPIPPGGDEYDAGYDSDPDANAPVDLASYTLSAALVSPMPANLRELLRSLASLLRDLSTSARNAAIVVKADGMAAVVDLLELLLPEPRDPLINICVEVLWNCLEHTQTTLEVGPSALSRTQLIDRRRKCNAMYALAAERPLTILKSLLEALIVTGHRTKDKELRNEVLIVASLIARHKKSHGFFRTTGLLELLLTYATAAETDTPTPADPHNFASVLAPDLELKRILWALLSDLSKSDADNMETIMGSELIETLLMYLSVDLQPGSGEGEDEQGAGAGVEGYLMETDQMATGVAAVGPAGMEAVSPGMTEGDAADAG
eukprot:CAMPEP_0119467934 /NCGR_PEP_ID=MMETSP1344-20130328/1905_1 /TAXON_ID=236787 /ORGANISM="Florenciella parvula, Strain CCMP2471" /LENGTH=529 /DNA_ID=CAMNT_0007500355 /DNA_START=375 /DNA_END=1960 /DNA_ORIENTATION=-